MNSKMGRKPDCTDQPQFNRQPTNSVPEDCADFSIKDDKNKIGTNYLAKKNRSELTHETGSYIRHSSFIKQEDLKSKPNVHSRLKDENCERQQQHSKADPVKGSEAEIQLENRSRHPHSTYIGQTWSVVRALIVPCFGLLLYFWDMGSDIRLAVEYRHNGDMTRFGITVGCIVIPHLLMAAVDVSWVYIDRRLMSDRRRGDCVESWRKRLLLGFLTVGRIVKSVTYMCHIYKAKQLPKDNTSTNKLSMHQQRARDEKRDACMLDFINAFSESAPQLFVQLYLYYRYDLPLTTVRVATLTTSLVSIAWTYAAYYRVNREALQGREDVTFAGFVFFFGAFLAALASRSVSIVLFLVYWSVPAGVIFIELHFLFMFLWIACKEKPELQGTSEGCWRYLYYVFFAYVCILGFMNLKKGSSKMQMTVFYGLIYVENIVLVSLTYWKMFETNEMSYISHFLVVIIGFIIHIILLTVYYKLFHPKTKKLYVGLTHLMVGI